MSLFFLAILAGFLTIIAPCILPVLPIVLGSGSSPSKARPLFVVAGFILSFSIIGAAFATAGSFIGLSQDTVRLVASLLLILFGCSMLFEETFSRFTSKLSSPLSKAGQRISAPAATHQHPAFGLLVGLSLGLIWTPCAGPILGTILTLSFTEKDFILTAVLFGAYALGAGIPMLAIAYGSGRILSRLRAFSSRAHLINRIFGALIILAGIGILTGYDRYLQAALIQFYPERFLPL
ncbi:cytochrome c biogenesis protein CcdA [Candidatus Uhrbacteria bacterium]|nr:cytochrome c biogenesis protein CcdA [Candidatus Uhrbacteria bacterium]